MRAVETLWGPVDRTGVLYGLDYVLRRDAYLEQIDIWHDMRGAAMPKDPWRIDEPLQQPPPKPRGEKMNLGDDLDDDLRVAAAYRFSCRGGSIKIEHVDAASRGEALKRLVTCLFEIHDAGSQSLFPIEYIGVSAPGRTPIGMRSEEASMIGTEEGLTIYFVNHTLEDGLVRLIRLLKAAERRHPEILEKWGVVPMSR